MPLIQCPFFDTPSINQGDLYFLPLNLSMLVTAVVVTLGHKNTMPSHHNITHFHLVLLRCPCLTQLPYCVEAQLAMQKTALMEKNLDHQLTTRAELPANSQHHLHLVNEPLSMWML